MFSNDYVNHFRPIIYDKCAVGLWEKFSQSKMENKGNKDVSSPFAAELRCVNMTLATAESFLLYIAVNMMPYSEGWSGGIKNPRYSEFLLWLSRN